MTTAGEVLIYDAQGKRVKAMALPEGAEVSPIGGPSPQQPGTAKSDGKDSDSGDESKGGGEGKEDGGASENGKGRVISVDWYDGAEGLLHPGVPTLCVALEGGTVQMSRGVEDPTPVVISAHMIIRQARSEQLVIGTGLSFSYSSCPAPCT